MVRHFLSLLLIVFFTSPAWSSGSANPALSQNEEDEVKKLMSFVEFLLNTVGAENVSQKEKATIISQTYLKAFTGDEAKVEDDLHDRDVIINKEIQNYLKDIDIFFRDVKFDIEVEDIQKLKSESGREFIKVKALRTLNGINFNKESVKNQMERYFEIIKDKSEGLKIASIYNAQSNSRLTLQQWWKGLSFEWKVIFQRKLQKEISSENTLDLLKIDELNIAYNQYVETLEPLNVLVNLKKLNISNTKVRELSPLYGLSNLEELHLTNTIVTDLGMVNELPSLKILSFENTEVSNITPLLTHGNLKKIICTNTRLKPEDVALLRQKLPNCEIISETVTLGKWWKSLESSWQDVFRKHVTMLKLEPNMDELSQISDLKKLDLSNMAQITDLSPIEFIEDLEEFDASGTGITDISALSKMRNLRKLNISNTRVKSLEPILSNNSLKHVNIDYTDIPDSMATDLLTRDNHPKVIFNSTKFVGHWLQLSEPWKKKLTTLINNPSTEQIELDKFYDILMIEELDISNQKDLSDLKGLALLPALKKLNVSKMMSINDPTPLTKLKFLEQLDCSYNPIESIEWLTLLPRLKNLNIEYTKVTDIAAVENLRSLIAIKLSGTRIKNLNALRTIDTLREVECNNTSISSISPLLTLQYIEKISCYNTRLTEKDVQSFKASKPKCDITFY